MDTTTAQWQQESGFGKSSIINMGAVEMGSINNECTKPAGGLINMDQNNNQMKKARPQEQLNCPRCNSTNTKFCYYNNYSLTQPRYFCKTCRRYWTEGGTLRNVPVGGGSRKNKKPSSCNTTTTTTTSASSSSSSKNNNNNNIINIINGVPDLNPPSLSQFISAPHHQGQDLNLGYFKSENDSRFVANYSRGSNMSSFTTAAPDPNATSTTAATVLYSSSGFPLLQEFKPSSTSLGFCVDGLGSRYSNNISKVFQENNNNNNGGTNTGRNISLFPFGEFKHISSAAQVDQNKGQPNPTGYWSGLLGGGSW